MIFKLQHSDILLGIESDMQLVLNIDLVPVDHALYTFDDGHIVPANFCDLAESDNKLSRIILLVEAMLTRLENNDDIDFNAQPLYVLLPELGEDTPLFIDWQNTLKEKFPKIFNKSDIKYFPFGRTALSLALTDIEQVFKEPNSSVYLLGVDSLYHDMDDLYAKNLCVDEYGEEGFIASEAVIFTKLTINGSGLDLFFNSHETVIKKHETTASSTLFCNATKQLKDINDPIITTFYAPGNGLQSQVNPWISAYDQLNGHINLTCNFKQISYLTGELGTCSPIFYLLHIYYGYENNILSGNTMQLSISDQLHQSLHLYSWTNVDKQ
ncbi:MAG: hypothetical protein KAH18_01725 [Psychromonas sp.]|nr:hypothetical protein [Psychromonas sp.]